MHHRDLAGLRPDTPQWLDLRGILFTGRCDVFANSDPTTGFVVCAWDMAVAVAAGQPVQSVVAAATAGSDGARSAEWHLLAPPESVDAVATALPDWRRRGVTLHTRSGNEPFRTPETQSGIETRLAPAGWAAAGLSVEHLPQSLRREYETDMVRRCPLAVAVADDRAVAFCYAAVTSESLWDIAVDTLASHRRRGLSIACVATLAEHMDRLGLCPVWGALDENEPSMRLAARLGFRPAAGFTSFVRS